MYELVFSLIWLFHFDNSFMVQEIAVLSLKKENVRMWKFFHPKV
jgi:hypothetical protein